MALSQQAKNKVRLVNKLKCKMINDPAGWDSLIWDLVEEGLWNKSHKTLKELIDG